MRWSLTRGSFYRNLTRKLLVVWKRGRKQEGSLSRGGRKGRFDCISWPAKCKRAQQKNSGRIVCRALICRKIACSRRSAWRSVIVNGPTVVEEWKDEGGLGWVAWWTRTLLDPTQTSLGFFTPPLLSRRLLLHSILPSGSLGQAGRTNTGKTSSQSPAGDRMETLVADNQFLVVISNVCQKVLHTYLTPTVFREPLDSSNYWRSPLWKFESVMSYHLFSDTCTFGSCMCHDVPCPLYPQQLVPHQSCCSDIEVLQRPAEQHQNWNWFLHLTLHRWTCKHHPTSAPDSGKFRQLESHRKCEALR